MGNNYVVTCPRCAEIKCAFCDFETGTVDDVAVRFSICHSCSRSEDGEELEVVVIGTMDGCCYRGCPLCSHWGRHCYSGLSPAVIDHGCEPAPGKIVSYYGGDRFDGQFPNDPERLLRFLHLATSYKGPQKVAKIEAMTRLEVRISELGIDYSPELVAAEAKLEEQIQRLTREISNKRKRLKEAKDALERLRQGDK